MILDRVPPHDQDAERALLGSVLLDRSKYVPDLGKVWYRNGHSVIWEAIDDLFSAGDPIDLVTVSSTLRDKGQLEKAGGLAYLSSLTSDALPDHAGSYAEIIKDHHRRRAVIWNCQEIASKAYTGTHPDELSADLWSAARNIQPSQTRLRPVKDVTRECFSELEERFEKGEVPGLSTGLVDLDRYLRLRPGALIVVAGRPGMGKTALAIDMARHNALSGVPVYVQSLEMTSTELNDRLMCALSGIPNERYDSGRLQDRDWARLSQATGQIAATKLWLDDTARCSSGYVRMTAERLAHDGLGLVVVDYVQRMREPGDWTGRRHVEVGEIAQNLKTLAKDLAIPVVLVSQLNRMAEGRKDQKPILSDLKESGDLEQEADAVVMLYRPEYYKKAATPAEEKGMGYAMIEKNRKGRAGVSVRLAWRGEITSFADLAR